MPIYEFYCRDCHTIYSFFSRRVETERSPSCPKCSRKKLERQVSRFAFSSSSSKKDEEDAADPMEAALAGMDEEKMEQAMMALASEAESVDENDPRAMARIMRKMMDSTGLPMNDSMEEAIRRMESGEDPDKIDEELGDALDSDDIFSPSKKALRSLRRKLGQAPLVDPTVYDM